MRRQWASKEQLEELDELLKAPLGWRDPLTGVELSSEAEEFALFERLLD